MFKIGNKLKFLMLLAKAEAVIARKFSGQGLGFADLSVLYAISQAPEGMIRRVDLAESVGLTASGVTRLLLPLEKTGFVKREAHPRDARVSYVALTKSGKEIFADALRWAEEKCDDLIPDAQAKKTEQTAEFLSSLV
jgi:DNA-binding MarR family transcriptional regulator